MKYCDDDKCNDTAVKSITFGFIDNVTITIGDAHQTKYTSNFCKKHVKEILQKTRHGPVLKIQKIKNE